MCFLSVPNHRVWEKPAKHSGSGVKQKSATSTSSSLRLYSMLSIDICKSAPKTADVRGRCSFFGICFSPWFDMIDAILKKWHAGKSKNLVSTFIRVTMGQMSWYDRDRTSVNVVWSVLCYNIDHLMWRLLAQLPDWHSSRLCYYMIGLLMRWGKAGWGKARSQWKRKSTNIKEEHIRQTMVKCQIRKKSCESNWIPWAFGHSSLDSWLPTGGPW